MSTDKRIAVFVVALVLILAGIFHARLGPDFWPLDRSTVGPNLVADLVTFAGGVLVGIGIAPVAKKAAHRFVDGKLEHIDRHNQWMAKHVGDLYRERIGEPDSHPDFRE